MNFIRSRSNQIIINLIKSLGFNSKKKIIIAFSLSLFSGLVELFTISSFYPLIELILKDINKQNTDNSQILFFGNYISDQLVLTLFVSFILLATFLRCISLYYNAKLSAYIGNELSLKIYEKSLKLPLIQQFKKNTSETIPAATVFIDNTTESLFFFLQTISCSIISFGIILSLFITDVRISLAVIILLSIIYFCAFILTKEKLNLISKTIKESSINEVKLMRESFGLIRDIILENSFKNFINKFISYSFSKRNAKVLTIIIGSLPKYIVEGLIIISLILLSILAIKLRLISPQELLPILGVYGIAIQRVLPLIQQIFNNTTFIRSRIYDIEYVTKETKNLDEILEFHDNEIPKRDNLKFKSLEIKNLVFNYKIDKKSKNILSKLNMKIDQGEKIGFIGETGSGKSTLLDIIMFLLEPLEGHILINQKIVSYKDKSYLKKLRSLIAHVPQEIYLSDSTISDNITFESQGSFHNKELIKEVSKVSCIDDFIKSSENGYETLVGEKGLRLSGGQRQRIGIARALYKKSNILILDEATSALDSKTEAKVIKSIYEFIPSTTILMVAHRITTLKYCDYIYSINNGKIEFKKTPKELGIE